MAKLEDILQERTCFKLVCGAGNENALEVERLVALYAKAGAHYFDLSANEDIFKAAKKGLQRVIPEEFQDFYFFNVSVGIKGDPHISKAQINQDKCIKCKKCRKACLQEAIIEKNDTVIIETEKCIGCGACLLHCKENAIEKYDQLKPLNEVLPPLVALGVDSIEFHAVSEDENEVLSQWNQIEDCYRGLLSICIDRSILGDKQLIDRIQKMISRCPAYSTIIQADGAPMSGNDDQPATTLQALACAKVIQDAGLPVYLLLSGGTNSQTTKLAKLFGIQANGVSIGSYARNIVRDYIKRQDFFENEEVFDEALGVAEELVTSSVNFLK